MMKAKWGELGGNPEAEALDRVDAAMQRYAVPPPAASARQATVDAALRAMGRQGGRRWHTIWEQIKVEARFMPPWYYLASAAIAAAGVCSLLMNQHDAQNLALIAGIVPLPALLGLLELFHGADEGMAEIECACRYSPARVLSARMAIIGAISCAISAALGFCTRFGSVWMSAGLVVIPFCLSTASGLYLSSALQGRANSAQVALAVAIANGVIAAAASTQAKWLIAVAPPCWLFVMALSSLLLFAALHGTLTNAERPNERMLLQWN